MKPSASDRSIKPRIIIHGGAGNITRDTISPPLLQVYELALTVILENANSLLLQPGARALDVAVHAVSMLEDDPIFNCGRGSVFTTAGTNELEASVMVSNGYRKRGVGCSLLRHVKNPIKLAKEMLVRGEEERGGGAGGHCQLSGEELERLAVNWEMEMVDPSYFWTKTRWEQHKRGLEKDKQPANGGSEETGGATWDLHEYVPQGTTGVVVLDSYGTIAVATSTGGLTNKLPGRIGDTPTLGAGFWAEDWTKDSATYPMHNRSPTIHAPILDSISRGSLLSIIRNCFTNQTEPAYTQLEDSKSKSIHHAVGISGTGNGDSFLKLNAARTTAAIARYSPSTSLADAIKSFAGPDGELQKSAGDRFAKGEGEAGMIGIELIGTTGYISLDFNRGMFRAYIDDKDKVVFGAFRE